MNRRAFFKGLAAAAPMLFLPKLITPTFKQTLKYGKVNPAWVDAELECKWIFSPITYCGEWKWTSALESVVYPRTSALESVVYPKNVGLAIRELHKAIQIKL